MLRKVRQRNAGEWGGRR